MISAELEHCWCQDDVRIRGENMASAQAAEKVLVEPCKRALALNNSSESWECADLDMSDETLRLLFLHCMSQLP